MVSIKPHHFVDIIAAFHDGNEEFEPHPYGHAVHLVSREIIANRDTLLEIELGADDICKPCRHNVGGSCDDIIDMSFRPAAPESKQEYNLAIDRRWCNRLGVGQGDRLTARELCQRIADHAGDITDIYRENPVERTADRQRKLQQGMQRFLAR